MNEQFMIFYGRGESIPPNALHRAKMWSKYGMNTDSSNNLAFNR